MSQLPGRSEVQKWQVIFHAGAAGCGTRCHDFLIRPSDLGVLYMGGKLSMSGSRWANSRGDQRSRNDRWLLTRDLIRTSLNRVDWIAPHRVPKRGVYSMPLFGGQHVQSCSRKIRRHILMPPLEPLGSREWQPMRVSSNWLEGIGMRLF